MLLGLAAFGVRHGRVCFAECSFCSFVLLLLLICSACGVGRSVLQCAGGLCCLAVAAGFLVACACCAASLLAFLHPC